MNFYSNYKAGFISISGLPNSGKSTLLNAICKTNLSAVSPKPQTTRYHIKGIITEENYQMVFIDTPGFLTPKTKIEKIMKTETDRAIKDDADIILLVIEPDTKYFEKNKDFFILISKFKKQIIAAINKIDAHSIQEINEIKKAIIEIYGNIQIIEISALKRIGLDELKKKIAENLPFSPPYYYDDILSDKWERYFVCEIIREQIFNLYRDEIPYSTEVGIEYFRENQTPLDILANIYVSKKSHKPILLGQQGKAIKKLRETSLRKIESFLGKKVRLELFVKIREDWQNDLTFINNLIRDYK